MAEFKSPFFASNLKQVIKGKLDIISLTALTYLFVFMLFYAVWSKFFPEMFDLLWKMWLFATSGLIIHEVMWGSDKDLFFKGTAKTALQKSELRKTFTLTGLAFTSIVITQFAVITLFKVASEPLTLQTLNERTFGALGAAIAEEFAFAWFLFSLFLFITKNVYISLFVDALLFALFHTAVGFMAFMGMPAYFPAIFLSRLILDTVYYLSGGRISVTIMAHGMINFFTVIAVGGG